VSAPVQRLLPHPPGEVPLEGLYLAHDLRRFGSVERPFVYSNFIASLDGRVSLPDPSSGNRAIPAEVANDRDWRLYMELAAQADVLLTSARHLRAVAKGRQTELLNLGSDTYPDLVAWRRARGLVRQPVVAALSPDLRLPVQLPARFPLADFLVVGPASAPAERGEELRRHGMEVVRTGTRDYVQAEDLVAVLAERGHGIIYSLAGPRVMHTLLSGERMDRLYLTTALKALGGEGYDTLLKGPPLDPPAAFNVEALYLDTAAPEGSGQLFMTLQRSQG